MAGPVLSPCGTVGFGVLTSWPWSLQTLFLLLKMMLGAALGSSWSIRYSGAKEASPFGRQSILPWGCLNVSTLVFLTVRRPTVQWLPWPWRSSKLLDTRQGGL